ncbi:MAG TPA: hypothetical protein VK652_19135 [Steroidobacteraceae bacterium]|nr:hypothetical protein [Steroidobacteraceae bacterium]
MGYVKCWTTVPVILFIAGCSSPPPPPKNNVFDPLTQQMDKARDVQKTVDEEAERKRKAIDDQERGESNR